MSSSIDNYPFSPNRLSKRKLEDYDDLFSSVAASTSSSSSSSSSSSRMRTTSNNNKNKEPICSSSSSTTSMIIQFFVNTFSGKTLVLHGFPWDTVESVLVRIHSLTNIPVSDQRLIYHGRQLYPDHTLSQSRLLPDSSLHLVSRLRSTHHPLSHQLVDSLLSLLLSSSSPPPSSKILVSRLSDFLSMTPKTEDHSACHFQIFLSASAPAALVMLYLSPHPGARQAASDAIRHFLTSSRRDLPASVHPHAAPVVLHFCRLLRGRDLSLYSLSRSTLANMLSLLQLNNNNNVVNHHDNNNNNNNAIIGFHDVFPFVKEIASSLSRDLDEEETSRDTVDDFSAFLVPVLRAMKETIGVIDNPSTTTNVILPCYKDESIYLHETMNALLAKMGACLRRVEETTTTEDNNNNNNNNNKDPLARLGWSYYLPILKQIRNISECFRGAEDVFWARMKDRKAALTRLIVTYTKRDEDHTWLLAHKEVLEFESRRHLVLMMLPDLREDYDELHEMLIDRSQMLSESFEYIGRAEPSALRSGLFMEFKHEEATGPGVLREWFFLVCQQIFNPENALFVACPNDRRRFFPNHVSKVHPAGIGLEYFGFAGRVIALALMHKLQVGIVFDRVFFLQLAGKKVSLEDIRDADPCMYNSCKKILELDADLVDSDALGLTFVREVEELGARSIVELCPDGKSKPVTSVNRQEYVGYLIEHRFVESIKEQVQRFAKGFADMLCIPGLHKLFFQSLELQDLDWMLHGSEIAISVEDWMAHTDYNGFKETDPQITWFWKIVGEMSSEQKKVLLFFWTSLKCLPVEGFSGLASRLYIYKSSESLDRLPSSHTCFYRICFPPYPSMAVMHDRLNIITQEHVSCSFGTW